MVEFHDELFAFTVFADIFHFLHIFSAVFFLHFHFAFAAFHFAFPFADGFSLRFSPLSGHFARQPISSPGFRHFTLSRHFHIYFISRRLRRRYLRFDLITPLTADGFLRRGHRVDYFIFTPPASQYAIAIETQSRHAASMPLIIAAYWPLFFSFFTCHFHIAINTLSPE
jgi:hypothetical protein